VTARVIPDKLLLSSEVGVDLVAIGMRSRREEVLCMVGGSPERATAIDAALESGFAPDARDPKTRERMGELVASLAITREPYGDVQVVRTELTTPPGTPPGFLLSRVATGSIPYIVAEE
jgi:hypothetical protein